MPWPDAERERSEWVFLCKSFRTDREEDIVVSLVEGSHIFHVFSLFFFLRPIIHELGYTSYSVYR